MTEFEGRLPLHTSFLHDPPQAARRFQNNKSNQWIIFPQQTRQNVNWIITVAPHTIKKI